MVEDVLKAHPWEKGNANCEETPCRIINNTFLELDVYGFTVVEMF